MKPWDIHSTCKFSGGEATRTRLPSTSTSLIFVQLPSGESQLVVMGPRTHALYFPYKDIPVTVNAQFHAGWAGALLGVPVQELTDRVVPLHDLWGAEGKRLHEELDSNPRNAANRMENALVARMTDNPAGALVREATRWLDQERLPETARRLNISERHLRTVFTGSVGVSPKRFVQVNRVRKVLANASAHKGAQLAAESGYYDQSHMTAEFRATMGVPLSTYLAGDLPATATC
ncbi:helix-turn-helix domain-containing protein [Kibdelosporangium philippinense]|uniref:Helix-turn-helix domain-containing protein n=1 Tax=Kibdelosporangium philippinense TaxID=211113 RepID=A0ABS8ZPJ3_9PSEU|nr:helix-turn-helix domain-containing protein [Kibdelosporangium philippinense]MCE7009683.1 helix-turn-helix domain-containing protein [Kibdelosporangium philippinense]